MAAIPDRDAFSHRGERIMADGHGLAIVQMSFSEGCYLRVTQPAVTLALRGLCNKTNL